jgi:hypothetical protein
MEIVRPVLVATSVAICLGIAAAEGVIANAGFERYTPDGDLPGWDIGWYSEATGTIAVSKESAHSGQASLECRIDHPEQFGYWSQESTPVPEGATALKLSAWCKAEDINDTFATVGIIFENAEGYWFDHRLWMIVVADPMPWTELSGYVAVPKGAHTMRVTGWVNYQTRGTGTFWFDDLSIEAAEAAPLPTTVFVDPVEPPAPTPDEEQAGFVLFSRDYTRVIFPDAKPREDERVSGLVVSSTLGEREPVVLAVHALRDLRELRVEVGTFFAGKVELPADIVEVRNIRFHPRDGEPRSGPCNETRMDEAPLVLEQRDGVAVARGRSMPFWLTVNVPPWAPPLTYQATVTVTAADAPAISLPLDLTVLPFKLDRADDAMFAMYTRMRSDPEYVFETFIDMKEHGMTGVGLLGASGLGFSMQDGVPHVEFAGTSPLEINLDAYTRAGFPKPALWLMGGDIRAFSAQQGPIASEAFANCYREIVRQIVEHAAANGWPEIVFQPIDEPYDHLELLDDTLRLQEILKSIPGVRTEGDGMNAAWHRFTDRAYELTDVIVLHDGPVLERGKLHMDRWWKFLERARNDGKEVWFYNVDLSAWRPEPMRFMSGFGLWQSGATGLISWSYMTGVNPDNPGAVYGQGNNFFFRYPEAPGESGGPTVGYEGLREGINDYRYLLTLKNRVERARDAENAGLRAAADDVWDNVEDFLQRIKFTSSTGKGAQGQWTGPLSVRPDGTRIVSGDHKLRNGWEFSDYAAARRVIAEGVMRLDALEDRALASR